MQQWHSLIYLNTLYCIISIFQNLPQQVQPHSISKISIIFQIGAKSNVSIKTELFHLLFRGRIMCLGAITLWSLQEALGSCRRWLLHIYQSGTSLSSREREVNTHTHTHTPTNIQFLLTNCGEKHKSTAFLPSDLWNFVQTQYPPSPLITPMSRIHFYPGNLTDLIKEMRRFFRKERFPSDWKASGSNQFPAVMCCWDPSLPLIFSHSLKFFLTFICSVISSHSVSLLLILSLALSIPYSLYVTLDNSVRWMPKLWMPSSLPLPLHSAS